MFNRGKKYGKDRDLEMTPYIIVENFEHITEKKCVKLDNENEQIYKKFVTQARKAEKAMDEGGLSFNLDVPRLPIPNNRDRYILWRKRNSKRHVIPQSEAVVYLSEKGFKLNKHYEAWQAIELCNELRARDNLSELSSDNLTNNFDKVYSETDQNILRRRSMYGYNHLNSILTRSINSENNISSIIQENEISMPEHNIVSHAPSAPPLPSENNLTKFHTSIYPSCGE